MAAYKAGGMMLWLVLLGMCSWVYGGKVLLLPMAHVSHVNLFGISGEALKKDGHDVTILVPKTVQDKAAKHKLKVLTYEDADYVEMNNALDELAPGLVTGNVTFPTIVKDVLLKRFASIVEGILTDQALQKQINSEKFDIAIVDGFPGWRPMFVLPYRLRIPHLVLSAVNDPWMAGVSASPGLEPFVMLPYSNRMNFIQRLVNTAVYVALYYKGQVAYLIGADTYVKDYAPNRPPVSIDDLYMRSDVFLINHEIYCLDYPKVSAPNYHYIGGLSAQTPKPLPKDLEDFMQGATDGVIVVSFGSAKGYKNVLAHLKDKLLAAFGKLPQRVLISADPERFPSIPANVKVVEWMPQNDVIAHKKTVLFLAHGGNNGQLEAIYHGVPLVTLPLTSEQAYNGQRAVSHGFGLMLDIQTFTAEELVEAVQTVVKNASYKQRAQKCADIQHDIPTAQSKVVFWSNHVMRHGSTHLQPARDVPLCILMGLDVHLVLFAVLYILLKIFFLFLRLIFMICRCCGSCCKKNKKKQKLL